MDSAVFERRGETTRLGSFEIVRKLARGGMAEIFLARTLGPSGFEKLVVLKKILPKYAGKPRFVQLFLEEAKLAASLDHPNIAQVYDIGMVDGSYFFTMEYLHGQDLRSILHRAWRTGEHLPIECVVLIARSVASALHFAHEKQRSDGALLGIVHRDVSPSNIIVTYDGATKLLDFGVAKTTVSTVKTRTGALKGKVSYMSPEQARGAAIDRRSDIFSLGVVLWEMVTIQRLFRGENDLATLQLIINHAPRRPSALRRDCPAELERIVLRALAQDPGERYQTAEQLGAELDELAREHKLKQSASALAVTIGQLFVDELAAWRAARAAGVPLADHINDVSEHTAPVRESDFIDAGSADDDDDDEPPDADDAVDDALADRGISQQELEQLGQLYNRDLDDDDNEKTEHVPVFVDPLPALGAELSEPSGAPITEPASPAAGRHPTPRAPFPRAAGSQPQLVPAVSAPAAQLAGPGDSPSTLIGPFVPFAGGPDPRAAAGHEPATTPDGLLALPSTGAVSIMPTLPASPPPVVGAKSGTPLAGGSVVNTPFTVSPWQSGQPGAPERPERSWAVIELPAVDPETFARHRRIALRVASGLVALILVLAIIAGRC